MEQNENPSPETKEKWHNDPDNWIWGVFYYCKEDPRIFPPKRIEWMGWTINFANPRSVLAFLGIMAFFIFLLYGIKGGN